MKDRQKFKDDTKDTKHLLRLNSAGSSPKALESAGETAGIPRMVTCPVRCITRGENYGSGYDKGVALVGPLSLGLLSFDEACIKSKSLKPKPKKTREVLELGKIT